MKLSMQKPTTEEYFFGKEIQKSAWSFTFL